jgi:hypothetical protein
VLSIFAVPKPFDGPIGVIQRNALRSWKRLGGDCQIILCGDDAGVANAANEFRVDHIPIVERNEFGTPLLSSVFALAERKACNDLMCYANADLIFFGDLLTAVERVSAQTHRFMLVGQCRDLRVSDEVDSDQEWDRLRTRAVNEGEQRGVAWTDYFVFPRHSLGRLPPFAVGRPAWDNWMIWRGRKSRLRVVNVSADVTVVHQAHDYRHIHGSNDHSRDFPWDGPERDANYALAPREQWMTMLDATDQLVHGQVQAVKEQTTFHRLIENAYGRLLGAWFGATRRLLRDSAPGA